MAQLVTEPMAMGRCCNWTNNVQNGKLANGPSGYWPNWQRTKLLDLVAMGLSGIRLTVRQNGIGPNALLSNKMTAKNELTITDNP
jgi:hypothetical protein